VSDAVDVKLAQRPYFASMRVLIIAAVALRFATAHAQPGAPSKTLERAIMLYDKQNFYSASIELKKVIDGESGDSAANKQRADFFMGKTLFQMKYYAASLAVFYKLAVDPTHSFHLATIKWLIAIADVIPGPAGRSAFRDYQVGDADDPMFDLAARDAFHYYFGRTLADRDDPRAGTELRAATGKARAALELAKLAFRAQQIDEAVGWIDTASRDPAVADDAARSLATWTRLLKVPPRAYDALKRLANTNDLALLEHSRIGAIARVPELAGISTETFDAVAIATTCAHGPNSDNAAAALRATVDELQAQATKLGEYDDNAEVYDVVEKLIRSSPALRLALLDAETRDERAWTTELLRELAALQSADKAWQTTQIAAEILQELTVQLSVGQADVGRRYRNRLEQVRRDLQAFRRAFVGGLSLSLGPPARPGLGITVAHKLCSSQLGMPASAVATPMTPIPVTPTTKKATGCAGCAANSEDARFALLLFAVGWIALRVRRKPR
jgi:hypothetical protein